MTPLRICETPCGHITIALAIDGDAMELRAELWAYNTQDEIVSVTLHIAQSFDALKLVQDYETIKEAYGASHEFTDAEIERRTSGRHA